MLIFDHLLRARRGVNRCSQYVSSNGRFWPSIQPKHNATSSASAYVGLGMPDAFLASLSHRPS